MRFFFLSLLSTALIVFHVKNQGKDFVWEKASDPGDEREAASGYGRDANPDVDFK